MMPCLRAGWIGISPCYPGGDRIGMGSAPFDDPRHGRKEAYNGDEATRVAGLNNYTWLLCASLGKM